LDLYIHIVYVEGNTFSQWSCLCWTKLLKNAWIGRLLILLLLFTILCHSLFIHSV